MKVHALARWPHLMDHLRPIHDRLPDSLRGEQLVVHKPTISHTKYWSHDDVVMVAGFADIDAAFGRKVIYVEHGAGQAYVGANPIAARHYHGSEHPDNVIGYIGPRQDVIDSWGRPGVAVGSPICDPYELFSDRRIAAITFHWNGSAPFRVGVPEAGTAFQHYVNHIDLIVAELRVEGWDVIGSYHPQFAAMRGFWARHGVREATADEIRRTAQLLIADNTSMLYEMMYLGRDVIALNAPWFRKYVEHGLRFWEHAPKMQVDDPFQLFDLIPELDVLRASAVGLCDWETTRYVYGKTHSDGDDGLRAATWITSFLATL